MKISRRAVVVGGTGLLAATSASSFASAADPVNDLIEGTEEFGTAVEAYTFGYPLVTMEMTRRVITNVAKPEGTKGPMGQIIKLREYPNASFRDVTAPNADTLYTTAFFDVGKEPWIVGIPALDGRYALFPMLDGWTNVFQVPGKRTTGTDAQTYAITGPNWSGKLPDGVKQYKSPTNIVWLLGRIYCTGTPEDYKAVHDLQDQMKLYPLSAYGKDYTPPPGVVDPSIDMKTAVRDQVNRMDAVEYFTLLCELMKDNPPAKEDSEIVERMAAIGIAPGQFDKSKFNPDFAKRVPRVAFDRIMLHFKFSDGDVEKVNGWGFTTKTGLLWRQLHSEGAHHRHRAWRKSSAGRRLPDIAEIRGRPDQPRLCRQRQIRHDLQEGADAAGERLLVVDDVRRELFLRRQSLELLFNQRSATAQSQCGRIDRSLHPE